MKKILVICIVVLLLLSVSDARRRRNKKRKVITYEYNSLSLTWPEEFCTESSCKPGWDETMWHGKRFTIHGFWPSSEAGYQGVDPACAKNPAFIDNALDMDELFHDDPDMLDEIDYYWPELKSGKEDDWFYVHEWNNHGSCYMMNLIKDNKTVSDAWRDSPQEAKTKIQRAYFRSTVEKLKRLNIEVTQEKFSDQNDFAKHIGFEGRENHFYLEFKYDDELDELRVCYSRTPAVGTEVTIPCPGKVPFRNTPFEVTALAETFTSDEAEGEDL